MANKKTYRAPKVQTTKILVSNLYATQCTACDPIRCPQLC